MKGIHFSMELWKGVGGGGVAHQLSEGKPIVDTYTQTPSKTSLPACWKDVKSAFYMV
jgi:hypothetical protein